jgi:zinc protease
LQQATDASGLQVVLEQAPDYGVAAVVLTVGAGAAQENPDQAGLAHLVEHLAYRSRQSGATLWNRVAELGGVETNGSTGWDDTRFFSVVPARNAQKLVQLFSEMLRQPLESIEPAAFQRELQIVRDEMHLRSENGVPGQALAWLFPEVFPASHPYAHPIVGTERSLEHLTLDDARAYASKWYQAHRSTLVVSAPQTLEQQAQWVRLATQPFAASKHEEPDVANHQTETPLNSGIVVGVHEAPVPVPELWIGWRIPSMLQVNGEPGELLPILAEVAYFMDTNRFGGHVQRIDAGSFSGEKGGVLYVKALLNNMDTPEATASATIAQLRSATNVVIYNAPLFARLKQSVALSDTYGEENILSRALRMAQSAQATKNPLFLRARDTRLLALENGSVAEYLTSLLSEQRAHVVLVKPVSVNAKGPARVSEANGSQTELAHQPQLELEQRTY